MRVAPGLRRGQRCGATAVVAIGLAGLAAGCGGGAQGEDPASQAAPTIEARLSVIEREVFARSCTFSSCHGGASPKQGLLLEADSHGRLVGRPSTQAAGRTLVVRGDPGASYLLEKLTSAKPAAGARMPEANAALHPGKIAAIRAWIVAGARAD